MSKLFAINKTLSNLLLKGGYISIPPKGFRPVSKDDAGSADFIDAEARGWLMISDTEPSSQALVPTEVKAVTAFTSSNAGMTAEELKASNSTDTAKPVKVTVEALGKTEQPTRGATSERIGAESAGEMTSEELKAEREAGASKEAEAEVNSETATHNKAAETEDLPSVPTPRGRKAK